MKNLIDAIKADREAGTPDARAYFGPPLGYFTIPQCYADQSRRARVPDMEAALLAAEELAAAVQLLGDTDGIPDFVWQSLADYRAAVEAKP